MTAAPIALQWRAWVAENLALGVSHEAIVGRLIAAGPEAAKKAIDSVTASNDIGLIAELVEATRRRRTIIDLQRELRAESPVAVESSIAAADFFAIYYCENRPVLLPGFVENCPQPRPGPIDGSPRPLPKLESGSVLGATAPSARQSVRSTDGDHVNVGLHRLARRSPRQ